MTQVSSLDNIYKVDSGEPMRNAYNEWADQYDADLMQHQYRTPARIAQALSRHLVDKQTPILDFACGTGLSGLALHDAGFSCIDGIDLSENMLAKAAQKGIYRSLTPCLPEAPFDRLNEKHHAIVAVGAIGAGAAPIECLSQAIEHLPTGGIFCVSLNDHTLEDPQFEATIADAVTHGKVDVLASESGEHLPEINLGARVYVIRKR